MFGPPARRLPSIMAKVTPKSWSIGSPASTRAVYDTSTALPWMSIGVFHHAPLPRNSLAGDAGWVSVRVPPDPVGSVAADGPAVVPSLKLMYLQQPCWPAPASLEALRDVHLPATGFGNVVALEMSAEAMPAGTTAAIVPMSAAEAAATPSLRTMAHPPVFVNRMVRGRGLFAVQLPAMGRWSYRARIVTPSVLASANRSHGRPLPSLR